MNWPSARVRDTFVQYFIRNSRLPHSFVASSPVVPRNDPTLAFTNAGMNQFKDVILGYGRPEHPRVVNSQKCLRINDLHLVGTDTYHHTFFEMLGNWSFSNYFKQEACVMAWDLLTNIYRLDPDRMYVTYFAGGDSIAPDLETKEIWSKIGVPKSRILPFGKENFWEMGTLGPCGPSTEIHYDHRGSANDPTQVNKDSGVVVELWNLVFMQYNRNETGKLERLPLSHVVDTGAGLERLTAVLNNKVSNYDSDLFYPIFDKIQKVTGINPYSSSFESDLDLSYRVFSDHMRATTVALADGVLPQLNHKIRRLIQRSLSITHTHFMPQVRSSVEIVDFLQEVVETVSSTLSCAFPEVETSKNETITILALEVLRYLDILKSIADSKDRNPSIPPLLLAGFPNLSKVPSQEFEKVKSIGHIDGKTSFTWYDRHGVQLEAIEELAVSLGLQFSVDDFKVELSKRNKVFRDEFTKAVLDNEDRRFVKKVESLLALYNPQSSGGVHIPPEDISKDYPVFIEWIFDEDGDPVEEICEENHSYWVLLNKSPFSPGNDNLESDAGYIFLENNCKVQVSKVKLLPSGWILHQVKNVPEIGLRRRASVIQVYIDNEKKYGREMSLDSLIYLKKWLKRKYGVVRFGEAHVFDKEIKLQVTLLHGDVTPKDIEELQSYMNNYAVPIVVTKKTGRSKRNGQFDLICATGLAAEVAMRYSWEVSKAVSELKVLLKKCEMDFAGNKQSVQDLTEELRFCLHDEMIKLPHETFLLADRTISEIDKTLQAYDIANETKIISHQLSTLTDEPYIVKAIASDVPIRSLKKIIGAVESKPVLLILYSSDGYLQASCSVPSSAVSDVFTAEKWMANVVKELGVGSAKPPKGQDSKLVVNIKRDRVQVPESQIKKAVEAATEYMKGVKISNSQTSSLVPPLSSLSAEKSSSSNTLLP